MFVFLKKRLASITVLIGINANHLDLCMYSNYVQSAQKVLGRLNKELWATALWLY